jgi:hypothetical protein
MDLKRKFLIKQTPPAVRISHHYSIQTLCPQSLNHLLTHMSCIDHVSFTISLRLAAANEISHLMRSWISCLFQLYTKLDCSFLGILGCPLNCRCLNVCIATVRVHRHVQRQAGSCLPRLNLCRVTKIDDRPLNRPEPVKKLFYSLAVNRFFRTATDGCSASSYQNEQ